MCNKHQNKNIVMHYPKLSSLWIKSDEPTIPLKRVWINESAIDRLTDSPAAAGRESAEEVDDAVPLAALCAKTWRPGPTRPPVCLCAERFFCSIGQRLAGPHKPAMVQ